MLQLLLVYIGYGSTVLSSSLPALHIPLYHAIPSQLSPLHIFYSLPRNVCGIQQELRTRLAEFRKIASNTVR